MEVTEFDGQKFIEFCEAIYCEEQELDEQKKGLNEDLKGYAENIGVNPKSLKAAYNLFKKFRSGKNSAEECDDYEQMSEIIGNYFASIRIEE